MRIAHLDQTCRMLPSCSGIAAGFLACAILALLGLLALAIRAFALIRAMGTRLGNPVTPRGSGSGAEPGALPGREQRRH
ncbi:hypothetical protein [Leucobacter sp. M11]|uniref:hypothetical protein n=1 Tax=Leucobacter sp. M11 TaxID=2993565 RepID=UPI002D7FFB0E|nr:hypothetical protein [Leucobacter sp. M11]MEB4616296.1 hypothetical protein [Leucobacter sp. M11]